MTMNSNVTQALLAFDDLIVWLVSRKLINQTRLNKLTVALKTLAENINPDETEREAEINSLTEKCIKLRLLIRACGLTEKAISELSEYSYDYLDEYVSRFMKSDNMLPICFPLAMDLFRLEEKIIREQAKFDAEINELTRKLF